MSYITRLRLCLWHQAAIFLLSSLSVLLSFSVMAEEAGDDWQPETALAELDALVAFDESNPTTDSLRRRDADLDRIAARASSCSDDLQEQIDRFRALQPLGSEESDAGDESPITELTDRMAACQFVLARAQGLREATVEAQARLQGQKLVARSLPVPQSLALIRDDWAKWMSDAKEWASTVVNGSKPVLWWLLSLAILLGIALGFWVYRHLSSRVRESWPVLSSLLPLWTAAGVGSMALGLVAPVAVGAAGPIAIGLVGYVVAQLGLGLWLRSAQEDHRLSRLRWQGAVLLATVIITWLGFSSAESPWARATLELLAGLQAVAVCITARGVQSRGEVWRLMSDLCGLVLIAAVGAWMLGYYSLAGFVILGITATWITWAVFCLVRTVIIGLLDGLDSGGGPWFSWLRRQLLIGNDQPLPGYTGFRLLAELVGLLGLLAGLMSAWSLERFGVPSFDSLMTDGFALGQVRFVPVKVALGLLLFAVLLAVFGRARHLLTNQLANRSRMNFATAETIATVTGYVGFVIAVLVGLGAAGFELSNLALILGALSVGIGFGLQNVVNNFVSGLILLFERPIKTGDWIRVGETNGYVTRIRVRSTEIQTLDRSEVIVPNSELIASQVTNYTLHTGLGRLIVPVGVAYGSDTEKVREVLLGVAHEKEGVLQQGSSAPKVIFKGFGDSSLDFELRCFLTDIRAYWPTLSELNFGIDAAFREAGIEIPFPQRDLHVRSAVSPSERESGV